MDTFETFLTSLNYVLPSKASSRVLCREQCQEMRPCRRRAVRLQLGAPGGRLIRARRRPGAADAVQHAVLHVRAQDRPLPPRQEDTVRNNHVMLHELL